MASLTLEEIFLAAHAMPDVEPIQYRLYHDEHGAPLFYSMEDKPGTYIEIDAKTFARAPLHARVKDGKLIEAKWQVSSKLIPGDSGTPCHPSDVAIVVKDSEEHTRWKIKIYEQY